MIIKLSSGEEIVLEDIVRDAKVEAADWLRKYRARKESTRRQAVPGKPRNGNHQS